MIGLIGGVNLLMYDQLSDQPVAMMQYGSTFAKDARIELHEI
jgi:hypothetical protein